MNRSPFSTPLAPTHTGKSDRTGRRCPLVYVDGVPYTRTDAKAVLSGFTREWDTFTDIRANQ